MTMWKQQPTSDTGAFVPDYIRQNVQVFEPTRPAATSPMPSISKQTVLTREMVVRGEITGEDALYIDGLVEGEINIPGERVTVGPNGSVVSTSKAPCITAQEVVVLGSVRGNIVAADRVEIRANGSITGDVSTVRLKIEDGSYFQGGIDIRKPEPKPVVEEVEPDMSLSNLEYEPATA